MHSNKTTFRLVKKEAVRHGALGPRVNPPDIGAKHKGYRRSR